MVPRRRVGRTGAPPTQRRARPGHVRRALGPTARQQLEQQDAQRVDVRRRRHGLARVLLRRRVLRREDAQLGPGLRRAVGRRGVQQLGDPEIQQLHRAIGLHQDVRRLDVAVDDQVLVGELDRAADVGEEPQPRVDRQPGLVTVARDRHALDVLHDEVRPTVRRGAAIVEPCDVRVLERGEDLPLVAEAEQDVVGVHPAPDQLERDALLELRIVAFREVDGAHPPAPDLLEQPVRADAPSQGERAVPLRTAGPLGRQLGQHRVRVIGDGLAQRLLGRLDLRQEAGHRVVQLGVAFTGAGEPLEASVRRLVQRLLEEAVDPLPPVRGEVFHR